MRRGLRYNPSTTEQPLLAKPKAAIGCLTDSATIDNAYWVIDRKRELGIMKALGAGNKYIICSMVLETTVLAAIGSILSLIVQGVMSRCLVTIARDTGIGMDLNIFNLVLAISITILFGLLAVIVPIKRAINADPVRIINHV